ncbi:MAG: hypothetical protein JO022_13435 [Acidobacteriaceae bacterium]|nr:hypothetical protein [Acidobacteriaceae bacterium]
MKQLTTAALVALLSVTLVECQQATHGAATDRQKMAALDDALKSGLITQDEYDAKASAIQGHGTPAATSPQPGPTRQFPLVDTVLNMTAYTVNAPANWKVEGAMMPPASCTGGGPMPTYSATAPDGLSGVFVPPGYDWTWGAGSSNRGDCLPVQQVISAKDFLTYFIRIKQLGFVREEPVPELAKHQQNVQRASRPGFTLNLDEARFLVRYQVGKETIDEQIQASVICNDVNWAGVGVQHHCGATVSRMFAPSTRLEATLPLLKGINVSMNTAWNEEWNATMVRHIRQLYQAQTEAMLDRGRQAEAVRMRQHEDFMASMERGRDLRNQQFRDGQYVKQQNKEDYVDYALDCHRISSDGTHYANIGNCPDRETPPR